MYSIIDIKKNYIKILIVVMVLLVLSVPFYFYAISNNITGIVHQRLVLTNSEIENTLKTDLKFLTTIKLDAQTYDLKEITSYFKNIIFIDKNGNIIQAKQNDYMKGINISNEDLFKKAKFYRKPIIKYVVQSLMNSYPAILIIVPKENGYVVGIVSDIITTQSNATYYILADSYNNINATNFMYVDLTGSVNKLFAERNKGTVLINENLYYFEKTKIMDNLYLYVLEKIKLSMIVLTIIFVATIVLSMVFLSKFLIKNIKMLSEIFDFMDTFSNIFTKSIALLKEDILNLPDEIFLYDERITKLQTKIFEFNQLKNSFNEFFKLILRQIEEISSRDEEIAAMNQDLESMYTEVENYSSQLALVIETIFRIDTELSVEEFLSKMHSGFVNIFDVETLIIFKINGKIYKIGSIIKLSDNILKIPLIVNYERAEEVIGNIFISANRKFNASEAKTYDMFAKILSIFITHKIKSQQIEELYLSAIKALANAVEIKDEYTRGHTERVAKISLIFAKHLGIDKNELNLLYQAAILHDIGKIGVPDAVLNKPGKLTDTEYRMIKEHPLLGFKIVMEIKGMEKIAIIIKHHHERWDGKGYPDGLKGEKIPYLSRLIAIVDSYDAMHSNRSYRKSLQLATIKEIFEREKGKQWDAKLVDSFLQIIDSLEDEEL